jgi:hypothetical protein
MAKVAIVATARTYQQKLQENTIREVSVVKENYRHYFQPCPHEKDA